LSDALKTVAMETIPYICDTIAITHATVGIRWSMGCLIAARAYHVSFDTLSVFVPRIGMFRKAM
jgi:hypothetical protein